ncbi:MAG: hypothetical protein ALECFALPRED_004481 [Alectoria fallacina]|uniref:Rhodopsin domain-containing protein n=1 Tax=Alectoria fallacina TaxID=1903189 RepID=A0A8H3FVB7_9LECA|nr:MAG: hypothetical protein ALECFALPRED_004481 [Alectoria fallacina]
MIECQTPKNVEKSFCASGYAINVVTSVINVITDIYVLALPIEILMRLNLKRAKKYGLIAIFLSGVSASLISLARLIFVIVRLHTEDLLWSGALASEFANNLTSIVETNPGIIAASMPALPQFFASSRTFHASTYSSLNRLINRPDPSSISWHGQSSKRLAWKDPYPQRGLTVRGESWTEIQSLPDTRAYGRAGESQDEISLNEGLVQTVTSDNARGV